MQAAEARARVQGDILDALLDQQIDDHIGAVALRLRRFGAIRHLWSGSLRGRGPSRGWPAGCCCVPLYTLAYGDDSAVPGRPASGGRQWAGARPHDPGAPPADRCPARRPGADRDEVGLCRRDLWRLQRAHRRRAQSACLLLAAAVQGRAITTIEGIAAVDGSLSPVQQAFLRHGGFQCGICTPGQVIAATALLAERPHPNASEVREWMTGNLCRCTGYDGIVASVLAAADGPGDR